MAGRYNVSIAGQACEQISSSRELQRFSPMSRQSRVDGQAIRTAEIARDLLTRLLDPGLPRMARQMAV